MERAGKAKCWQGWGAVPVPDAAGAAEAVWPLWKPGHLCPQALRLPTL